MSQQLSKAQKQFTQIKQAEKEHAIARKNFVTLIAKEFEPMYKPAVIDVLKMQPVTTGFKVLCKLAEDTCDRLEKEAILNQKLDNLRENFSPAIVAQLERFAFIWSLKRLTDEAMRLQREMYQSVGVRQQPVKNPIVQK